MPLHPGSQLHFPKILSKVPCPPHLARQTESSSEHSVPFQPRSHLHAPRMQMPCPEQDGSKQSAEINIRNPTVTKKNFFDGNTHFQCRILLCILFHTRISRRWSRIRDPHIRGRCIGLIEWRNRPLSNRKSKRTFLESRFRFRGK